MVKQTESFEEQVKPILTYCGSNEWKLKRILALHEAEVALEREKISAELRPLIEQLKAANDRLEEELR